MLRRWIIRTLALTLLTLCVTAWVGSYFEVVVLRYADSTRNHALGIQSGSIYFMDQERLTPTKQATWSLSHDLAHRERVRSYYEICRFRLWGFGYAVPPDARYSFLFLILVPLWFPTTLSALQLWLIWRKTRPHSTAKGFPIEPLAKEANNP